VRTYLNKVRGRWDGKTDYIADFARRISSSDYCQRMVRIWLRAVVTQWLGADRQHANAVMLLLISPQQGLGKSTLFTSMLPREIADYYTDDFKINAKGNAYRKMVEFAIVSLDEFEKIGRKQMPELKSMMQTLKPSFIGAYQKNFNQLPRIASFVGTTNERHVLTDRTGSRRFLILEPDGIINVEGINHDQLYAQVLHEIENEKLPHWFSKEDEAEMEKHNKDYYVLTDVERLFLRYFSIPEKEDEGAFMSGPEIMRELEKHSQKTMAGVTANAFGRSMTRLGVRRVGRHETDGYLVMEA
jgi:predicted P-loop ATPase